MCGDYGQPTNTMGDEYMKSDLDEATQEKMDKVNWIPLESNPEMLTGVARRLGLPKEWGFSDIYGS
jgi:hypothetical protein